MEIDEDKIDDAVLVLLWLTLHYERCASKGFDWSMTDRLYEKGLIRDPVNKWKSLLLTDEVLGRSEELFSSAPIPNGTTTRRITAGSPLSRVIVRRITEASNFTRQIVSQKAVYRD